MKTCGGQDNQTHEYLKESFGGERAVLSRYLRFKQTCCVLGIDKRPEGLKTQLVGGQY